MDVSIIVVNYNTKELTRNCLKSIFEQTKNIEFEVIVSDNGSTDGSLEMIKSNFPKVILIENNSNLGFGAANNKGLKIARGKYIFYLNSDTVLLNNAVKIFFDYWETSSNVSNIGAIGAWLLNNNKTIIHSYGDFPTFKNIFYTFCRAIVSSVFGSLKSFRKSRKILDIKGNDIEIKGYITGADLFLKNNSNALFDERYFMYFEESDLQFNNFAKKYLKIILLSSPKIIHLEGQSDKKSFKYDFRKKSSIFYWQSCLKYFAKNLPQKKLQRFLLKTLIILVYVSPFVFKYSKKYIKDFFTV